MNPKFQSSFIPKGTAAAASSGISIDKVKKQKNFLSFIAGTFFFISLVLALGVFGYKLYLSNHIDDLAIKLQEGKDSLQVESIEELIKLNKRIIATNELIQKHQVLSPLFSLLEQETLKNVRFNSFSYTGASSGGLLMMKGEARGYAALALQADALERTEKLRDLVFSDFGLDAKGNVTFSLQASVNPELSSYTHSLSTSSISPQSVSGSSVASSSASTTPR